MKFPFKCVISLPHLPISFSADLSPLTFKPFEKEMPPFDPPPPLSHPLLYDREGLSTERKAKKWCEKGKKNKIIWRLHKFFMNFHLSWESLLTPINRSSCCHTVST